MKLLWCPECDDKFQIPVQLTSRFCRCGQSWGRYVGPAVAEDRNEKGHVIRTYYENVMIGGIGKVFGIGNELFQAAAENRSFVFIGWFYHGQTIGTEHIHFEEDNDGS